MMKAQSMGSDDARSMVYMRILFLIFSAIFFMLAIALFIVTMIRFGDTSMQEWIDYLNIHQYNYGLSILTLSSVIVAIVSIYGVLVVRNENSLGLNINAGLLVLCFVLSLAGTCYVFDYSTSNSSIQPLVRRSMRDLISNSQHDGAAEILRQLQEGIGCCGADGPNDYTSLLKPLPAECRDTVTGNAFFHSCVEELTWNLEYYNYWIGPISMSIGMLSVILAVMSHIFAQMIRRDEEGYYR